MTNTTAHDPSAAANDFENRARTARPGSHRALDLGTVMVNVGLRCNLACELCHHSSSPERTEMMSRETMLAVARFVDEVSPGLLDITGGEPALWPLLPEFLALTRPMVARLRVRTNLDVLLQPRSADVMRSLAENRVEVLASLPEALEGRTIGGCVDALQRLNALGYGDPASGAKFALDLAYNPLPGEMPREQSSLEAEFRAGLAPHGLHFRSLLAIANFPIGGFRRWLEESGGAENYRQQLRAAFNPDTLAELTCRHGIEVGWDGTLWDCDFNLATGVALSETPRDVGAYLGVPVGQMALASRRISFAEHCYACTAGRGSG